MHSKSFLCFSVFFFKSQTTAQIATQSKENKLHIKGYMFRPIFIQKRNFLSNDRMKKPWILILCFVMKLTWAVKEIEAWSWNALAYIPTYYLLRLPIFIYLFSDTFMHQRNWIRCFKNLWHLQHMYCSWRLTFSRDTWLINDLLITLFFFLMWDTPTFFAW